jgi:hypothetical protein
MPSPNLSQALTATFETIKSEIHDNVMDNNALLAELKKSGRIQPVDGGNFIRHNLSYDENGSYTRYQGSQAVNIAQSDFLTAAQYPFRYVSVSVSMTGQEEAENSGKSQLINLLKAKIENAKTTFANNMSTDIYSDGTASGGLQINGLQSLISKTPTSGIVGGINANLHPFWQNRAFNGSAGADFGGSSTVTSSTNILDRMTTVFNSLVRGADQPDLIVADQIFWDMYHNALLTPVRFIDKSDTGNIGFPKLAYRNVPVIMDGGVGGKCPARTMYFINTKHLKFCPHKDRNFKTVGDERRPVNQDMYVILNLWAGNLTCGNRSLQGVFYYNV